MAKTSKRSLLARLGSRLGMLNHSAEQLRLLERQAKAIERLSRDIERLKGEQAKARKQDQDALAELSRKLGRLETAAKRKEKEQTRIRHFIDLEEGLASARLVLEEMPDLQPVRSRIDLLALALKQVALDGLYLEFGVYQGETIRAIAERLAGPVHGFDSFEGLPEAGGVSLAAGQFDIGGSLPPVPDNVSLHKGWFDETLPRFLETHAEPVAFLHVDCDIYSSTKTVLDLLAPRLRPGTVIVFDEYLNFPAWRRHEIKAFGEAAETYGWRYDYIGRTDSRQVAVKLTAVGTDAATVTPADAGIQSMTRAPKSTI